MSDTRAPWPVQVDPRLPQPAHEQIYRQIRAAIQAGYWPPGTTLPPVRALAEWLGVHFNTVARAYQRLAREGWVITRPGSGTYVQALRPGHDWRTEALEDLAWRYVTQALWLDFPPAAVLAAVERALAQVLPPALEGDMDQDAVEPAAPGPD